MSTLSERFPHAFTFDFDKRRTRHTIARMDEVENWLMSNANGLFGWTVSGEACSYRMTYWIKDARVAEKFKSEFRIG
jgi:hypothetical protein